MRQERGFKHQKTVGFKGVRHPKSGYGMLWSNLTPEILVHVLLTGNLRYLRSGESRKSQLVANHGKGNNPNDDTWPTWYECMGDRNWSHMPNTHTHAHMFDHFCITPIGIPVYLYLFIDLFIYLVCMCGL